SMTATAAPWAYAPVDLRRFVDLEFASGINRPVIHTSVHQPVDDRLPGLSLVNIGQMFTRHETWAGMARPWIDYIARSSLLLQAGR
ncbi:glycosyl hydrolase, partial [Acinetobacter baumannii]